MCNYVIVLIKEELKINFSIFYCGIPSLQSYVTIISAIVHILCIMFLLDK